MTMSIRQIFVPVDGSAVSTHALDFAIERAKLQGAGLTVGFAVNRASVAASVSSPYAYVDPTPLLDALEAEAVAVLDAAEARVKQAGLTSKRATIDGAPVPAILAFEKEQKPDAIVMGTHGRHGLERLVLGSTAEGVIRRAEVPVIVVPPAASEGAIGHILVAVDGSPAAALALDFACELGRAERAKLTLCSVVEEAQTEARVREVLDEAHARAACAGCEATTTLLHGGAVEQIVSIARASADAIVMGTHGRAGIPRFVVGSVAEGVLALSPIPVCTIRHR
ncbi:MAG TPA: universal stress protein [Candidatus Baltobacteraceae bacterium]|nr:universal stress protein [Candidatus Baltobacteraceae bacterium]